jgi:hypothetical protein
MKKATFVFIALCLLGSLVFAKTNEKIDTNSIEVESQENDLVATQVQKQDNKPLPIKVSPEVNQEFPMKVELNITKPLKVELALKHNEDMSVKGKGQTSKWFPVRLEKSFENRLATYGALAAAIGACVGAWAAWRSASRTRLAAEGRLFFDLIKEYSSPRMLIDLITMFDWYRDNEIEKNDEQHADEKAEEWIKKLYDEKEADAIKINKARRHITHYFLNIWSLQESGYVKKGLAERICKDVGTEVLNAVFPLEKALRKHVDELDGVSPDKTCQKIREFRDKFDKLLELSSGARYRE